MTTILASTTRFPARFLMAGGLAALAAVGSLVLSLLSLGLAEGVTAIDATSYETEFIDPTMLRLIPLLLPVIAFAAYHSARVGAVALVAAAVPLAYAVQVSIQRTDEAGFGSGLEMLSWVIPVGFAAAGLVAVVVGALIGHARRRHH